MHAYKDAIAKLRRAVACGSSPACLTLAKCARHASRRPLTAFSLYSSGDNAHLAVDHLAATRWLIKGLELEAAKPPRRPRSRDGRRTDSEGSDESDEGIADDRTVDTAPDTVYGEATDDAHPDLALLVDMSAQLLGMFRYGRLSEADAGVISSDVREAAQAVLDHRDLALDPKRKVGRRTQRRRAIRVQLAYLLALLASAPGPSLKGKEPALASPTLLSRTASSWFRQAIEVAALPGGTADKRADALWPMAIRRLRLAGETVDPALVPQSEAASPDATSPWMIPQRIILPSPSVPRPRTPSPPSSPPYRSKAPPSINGPASPTRSFAASLFRRWGSSVSLLSAKSATSMTPSTRSLRLLMAPSSLQKGETTSAVVTTSHGIVAAPPRTRSRYESTLTDPYRNAPAHSVGVLPHSLARSHNAARRTEVQTRAEQSSRTLATIRDNLRAWLGSEDGEEADSDDETTVPSSRPSIDATPRASARTIPPPSVASDGVASDAGGSTYRAKSALTMIVEGDDEPRPSIQRLISVTGADDLERIVLTERDVRDDAPPVGANPSSPSALGRSLKADDLFFAAVRGASALGMHVDSRLAAIEDASALNVSSRCAICGVTGKNFSSCAKCRDVVVPLCGRACRVQHRSTHASSSSSSAAAVPVGVPA